MDTRTLGLRVALSSEKQHGPKRGPLPKKKRKKQPVQSGRLKDKTKTKRAKRAQIQRTKVRKFESIRTQHFQNEQRRGDPSHDGLNTFQDKYKQRKESSQHERGPLPKKKVENNQPKVAILKMRKRRPRRMATSFLIDHKMSLNLSISQHVKCQTTVASL